MKFKLSLRDTAILVAALSAIIMAFYLTQEKANVIDPRKTLPMVVFEDKDKLWQVVTYSGEPVTAFSIEVFPKYEESLKKVYINYRSQFVFHDGTPILLDSEPLFWNRAGEIVDYNYNYINEGLVFFVGNKGMKPRTAMTLKTLKEDLRNNVLKEEDILRNKQISQIAGKGKSR
ncbi:hypothetical protein [Pseudoalteromonas sp. MEBiC 03485]|uniref:hypothetical protein n=1 Tax=Pseudoalteromonas sp. MEBiC 03485 TaxID=2571103 RepID=UPI001021964E|nr:hypothetical protein [Pseudoalteromonas sp. MEBiC 03485]RZD19691.1 hypothetical protein EVU92_21045 [Pseudoalteromonas sp. MEBiC 03485]